jgi:hypothetical protein
MSDLWPKGLVQAPPPNDLRASQLAVVQKTEPGVALMWKN